MNFTLQQDQYEALIALARKGAANAEELRRIDAFLQLIEKANGVTRSWLWVQWQELDEPLPPGTSFPDKWPPEKRKYIELTTRKVAKADVDAVLAAHAKNPTSVLVTTDPGATLGWTPVDDYFTE